VDNNVILAQYLQIFSVIFFVIYFSLLFMDGRQDK